MGNKFRRCLIVLGMHRSGTSALTGALSLLGIDLGQSLIPAHAAINAKGYWEHRDIVEIHERLLGALGSSWHDERPLPENWWRTEMVVPFRRELLAILHRDFSEASLWGVKDPRICRLLPLWLDILEEFRCQPLFVLIVRHPQEVAESLAKRDGIADARAYLLWLQHTLDAEKWTCTYSRVLVSYERLLKDWPATMSAVSDALSLPLALEGDEIRRQVDAFLEPSMRHCAAVDKDDEKNVLLRLVLEGYRQCLASDIKILHFCLAEVDRETEQLVNLIAPWAKEIQFLWHVREDLATANDAMADREKRLELLAQEMERVKSSFSWQITKPVRLMSFLWNQLKSRFGGERN